MLRSGSEIGEDVCGTGVFVDVVGEAMENETKEKMKEREKSGGSMHAYIPSFFHFCANLTRHFASFSGQEHATCLENQHNDTHITGGICP